MISDMGSTILPTTKWISLTSALTWLAFDRAVEVEDIAMRAAELGKDEQGRLLQILAREWHALADYACDGSVSVRAKPELGHIEVALGVEELRTYRHIAWVDGNPPRLVLDRFPLTFAGAFKAQSVGLRGGLLDPVTSRSEVIKFKQVISRARRRRYALSQLRHAKTRAKELLTGVEPQTGLKRRIVETLMDEFAIPRCRAVEIWQQVTPGWPKHGRPNGSKTRQ